MLLVSVMASVVATSAGQDATVTSMKDVARRLGGTAKSKIHGESPSMSLGELVALSELIIRGRLETRTTRLSDDESNVFRDFGVTPLAMIKQHPVLAQAAKPGPLAALTLRQIGGKMVVDGLTLVTTTNFEDGDNPMEPGQEYVLFLSPATPSPSTTMSTVGVFQLTSVHWGAFPIRNNKVENFTRWVARRTNRTTDDPETFIAQIRELVGTPK